MSLSRIKSRERIEAAWSAFFDLQFSAEGVQRYDSKSWSRLEIASARIKDSLMTLADRELPREDLISIVRDKLGQSNEGAITDLPPVKVADILIED